RQRRALPADRARRCARPRPAGAVPVLQDAQAVVEDGRRGGGRGGMNVSVNDAARTRRTTYIVLGVAFVAYSAKKSNAQADQKADQYLAELSSAGLYIPTKELVVRTLGDDGGATCADPNSALKRGALLGGLTNGA